MNKNFWLCFISLAVILAILSPIAIHPVQANITTVPDYVFPVPGSTHLKAETSIIVRFPGAVNSGKVSSALFDVYGQQSGRHSGQAVVADDQATVTFTSERPFSQGEKVTVAVTPNWLINANDEIPAHFTFSFQVEAHPILNTNTSAQTLSVSVQPTSINTVTQKQALMPSLQNYLTLPANFPPYTINQAASADNQGYYFLAPFKIGGAGTNYLLTLDNNGEPVYYQALPINDSAHDFKKQPNGLLSYFDSATSSFVTLNSSYQIIKTYTAMNGYTADVHDFQMLPNNHVVFLIYDPQIVDMSQVVVGGNTQAQVVGLVIQELDSDNNVVFQWRSWDHINITDADDHINLLSASIDYVHGNAIQFDWDGNYLLSSRHLDEITKINRQTGNIIWRLGGKQNQFVFTNVDISSVLPFSHQHDIRRLPDGHITIFDNRNNLSPLYARAVEYALDEDTKTITEVWDYHSTTPDMYSSAMGDAQRLANGNTVIGWGLPSGFPLAIEPDVTEVKPDGTKIFELTFDLTASASFVTYRAFRFTWQGIPTWSPAVAYKYASGQITLGTSWNGDTQAAKYEFYAAQSLNDPPQLLGTVIKTGFETQYTFSGDPNNYCYFETVALDSNGQALKTSNQTISYGCLTNKYWFPLINK
jgi:hypothetical protein